MPRIIAIANRKGGVGKTTTTVNVATAMAAAGKKVLVVDLDPQGNATTSMGVNKSGRMPSSYEVLLGEKELMKLLSGRRYQIFRLCLRRRILPVRKLSWLIWNIANLRCAMLWVVMLSIMIIF